MLDLYFTSQMFTSEAFLLPESNDVFSLREITCISLIIFEGATFLCIHGEEGIVPVDTSGAL